MVGSLRILPSQALAAHRANDGSSYLGFRPSAILPASLRALFQQQLGDDVVESDMGQRWNPPKTEDDEVENLIQLAADRRLALRSVRTMESKILSRFHLLEESPTLQ
jgi:hypothetical protein